MKFRCVNSDEMDGILTKGREYAGEMACHRDFIKIYRCDDKKSGFFEPYRFETVEEEPGEPLISIFRYEIESKL